MPKAFLGAASSHAFALLDPDEWDDSRLRNRRGYERRYGLLPPEQPEVALEDFPTTRARYERIRSALLGIRDAIAVFEPDVLILIADDQNENFTQNALPQFAIYVGDQFVVGRLDDEGIPTRSNAALAEAILAQCIESDIDLAPIYKVHEDRIFAHAFGPVLKVIDPNARVRVIPIFANAVHHPAPSGRRCYYVGQIIRQAVERFDGVRKVCVYGSGGLSHFTAGYPWKAYHGPFQHGAIDEEFDRWVVRSIGEGNGHELAELTSADLLEHGEIELRSWIMTLGCIGDVKPSLMVYEPFYRAIMGMGAVLWA